MHDLHMRTINGSSWRIQFPRRIEYRSVLGTARVAQRDVITNRRFHLIEYLGCGIRYELLESWTRTMRNRLWSRCVPQVLHA